MFIKIVFDPTDKEIFLKSGLIHFLMAGDNGQGDYKKPDYNGVIKPGTDLSGIFDRRMPGSSDAVGFGTAYRAMFERRERSPDHIDHGIEPVPKGLDKKVEESQ